MPRFLGSLLKRKGGRGVVGRPLPTKRGKPSGVGYTRAATRFYVIDNPCLYQGHRHLLGKPGLQRLLAGVRHTDSFVYSRSSVIPCLYQVIGNSFVYTRRSELFTPVAVVWRALLGLEYSREAIPGPFAGLAPGRAQSTRLGGSWTASFLQSSRLRDVHNGRRPFSTM